MVKAVPPAGPPLKFQGRIPWPIEAGVDDWGLTPAQQETYVEQFRRHLEKKNAWREDMHDYYTLRRFMRARTYDIEKATFMWMNNLAFKKKFQVDTILTDFTFTERDKFLLAYPQGYHKCDKQGRPIYIQLLGQVDVDAMKRATNEERMIKFHIQEYERCAKVILPICSKIAGRQIDQTFGIIDVKGVGLSHFTGEVKRLMGLITRYDQDNYPEMLGHVCVINAPGMFRMIWAIVKGMLDPRTQAKIEILGTHYMPQLTRWVDVECLPDWLGGKSHGTLIDDVGPWSDTELVASLGLNVEELMRTGPGGATPQVTRPNSGELSRSLSKQASASSSRTATGERKPLLSAQSSLSKTTNAATLPATAPAAAAAAAATTTATAATKAAATANGHVPAMATNPAYANGTSAAATGAAVANGTHDARPLPSSLTPAAAAATAAGTSAAAPRTLPALAAVARPRTLLERVAALEAQCPQVKDRLKQGPGAGALQQGGGGGGGHSTRSAMEGSLLYRVEVLEEAMEVLLASQEAAMVAQKAADKAAREAAAKAAKAREGCACAIM